MLAAILISGATSCLCCKSSDDNVSTKLAEFIPNAPDYGNDMMWVTADGDTTGTGADIFYVVSTWEEDWTTPEGRVCHYADVWNPEHREHMAVKEINKVTAYMSPGNRFFAPYYRHTTLEAFLSQNEDTIHNRTRLAMDDVCKAFDHFQARRDKSRPLIIAGFSQGGLGVVELLKHIDDETYSQLAAAYVLGYKVTPEDTIACKHIKAAKGETDTGVTICYNTVKDVKYIQPVIAATCMGINPVNWRIDATPATLHDTITVTLSPDYHVLVVSGYSGSEYPPYRGFLNVGDIHSCEPWLYSECLAKNIAVRAKRWHDKNGDGDKGRVRQLTIEDVPVTRSTLTDNGTTLGAAWEKGDVATWFNLSSFDSYTMDFGSLTAQSAGAASGFSGTITGDPAEGNKLAIIYPASTPFITGTDRG